MLTYVIADIHGYSKNLIRLLNLIACFGNSNNKYIFIGDYINKGPDSFGVISLLIDFNKYNDCYFLSGNHEYKLMKKDLEFFKKYGGLETARSYLNCNLDCNNLNEKTFENMLYVMNEKKHLSFLDDLKFFKRLKNHFVFHSGYNTKYEKLEDILLNDYESLLFSRFEFIESKKLLQGKKIIFGHTGFKNGYCDKYKIGIDFGVAYYGNLAAYCIETDTFTLDNGKIFPAELTRNETITSESKEYINIQNFENNNRLKK